MDSSLPTRRPGSAEYLTLGCLAGLDGASSLGGDAPPEGFGSDETGPPVQINSAPAAEPAMSTVRDMHLGRRRNCSHHGRSRARPFSQLNGPGRNDGRDKNAISRRGERTFVDVALDPQRADFAPVMLPPPLDAVRNGDLFSCAELSDHRPFRSRARVYAHRAVERTCRNVTEGEKLSTQ